MMPPTPMIGNVVRSARNRTTWRARLVSGAPERPPASAARGWSAEMPSRPNVVLVAMRPSAPAGTHLDDLFQSCLGQVRRHLDEDRHRGAPSASCHAWFTSARSGQPGSRHLAGTGRGVGAGNVDGEIVRVSSNRTEGSEVVLDASASGTAWSCRWRCRSGCRRPGFPG